MRNLLFYLLILSAHSNAQIHNYVTPIELKGSMDFNKLYRLVEKESGKNVFLLSESTHDYFSLAEARTGLLNKIIEHNNPEKIFYETSLENELLSKLYLSKNEAGLHFPKVNNINYGNTHDLLNLKYDRNHQFFFSNIKSDNVESIDIGTSSSWLGLQNLCSLTKEQNAGRNPTIDHFCDSLLNEYRLQFFFAWRAVISDSSYKGFKSAKDGFISALKSAQLSNKLIFAWENIFAHYHIVYARRALHEWLYETEKYTTWSFLQLNSFRDSVLYDNLKKLVPDEWNNLAVLFTSLHLMDTRGDKPFADIMDNETRTLGRYIHSDTALGPYLRRIAFVCYDPDLKGETDGKGKPRKRAANSKQSLEYRLAKEYSMAYVDLKSYREKEVIRKPFYMNPSLGYRKWNWEQIFDGVVFIKDCKCEPKIPRPEKK